jgi:ABC-2 type transporter
MTKLKEPLWYFLDMFLSLLVAEALAQMVSHVVPHFIIGMAMLAGLYGFFMLCQGFMLTPSNFPNWLEWLYNIAPHSYAWRTFMTTEFQGETYVGSDIFQTGEDVLNFYEIGNVDRASDMIVLAGYAIVVHVMSLVVLQLRHTLFRGKIVPAMVPQDLPNDFAKEHSETLCVQTAI